MTIDSPGAVTAAPPVPLRAKRAIWLFIVYWLVQIGIGLVAGIGIGMVGAAYYGNPTQVQTLIDEVALFPITLLAILGAGATVFLIVRSSLPGKLRQGAFAPIGWTRGNALHAVTAAFIGAAFAWFYLHTTTSIAPPAPTQQFGPIATAAAAATEGETVAWVAWFWAAMLLAAAPIEEFLFRGVMLEGFRRSFGPWIAAVLVSLLFVASHLFETGTYLPAILFISTLAIGTVITRLATRSLVAPICMHAAYNLTLMAAMFS